MGFNYSTGTTAHTHTHLLQFAVLSSGHVQVRVGQTALVQEVGHEGRLVGGVLNQDPVELRNVEEGLRQTYQLGLLHQPGERPTQTRSKGGPTYDRRVGM